MKFFKIAIFVSLIIILMGNCLSVNNDLVLKMRKITHDSEFQVIEKVNGIEIVNMTEKGTFGRFTNHVLLTKPGNKYIGYEVEANNSEWVRISKEFIALVKPYKRLNRG